MFLHNAPSSVGPAPAPDRVGRRFVLWIDGVGGFLVCLDNEITLGQPDPHRQADVAICGDLSPRHAIIRRDGEGYVIKSGKPVAVDNRRFLEGTNLHDGCEVDLGADVRFRFRQPHALSASACLEPISSHQTQPTTDGVLLMAESLVLGPLSSSHVACSGWSEDVVLYQHAGELYCRSGAPLEIDGAGPTQRGRVSLDSRVSSEDFAFSLEELS
ncbi:MAG: FHA domain-containing protein [Planctomycetales bacterium]